MAQKPFNFTHPYWEHLQIRQAEVVDYLNKYLNLNHTLCIHNTHTKITLPVQKNWLFVNTPCELNTTHTESLAGKKKIVGTLENLPVLPESIPNIVLLMGTSLTHSSAILHECHMALKPEGLLIVFSFNQKNPSWKFLSYTLYQLHAMTKVPKTSIETLALQWNFFPVENFSFSLLPPLLLKFMPFLKGKMDSWCLKFPLPIGQCSATVLQKKDPQTLHSIAKKNYLSILPKMTLHTSCTNTKCEKK